MKNLLIFLMLSIDILQAMPHPETIKIRSSNMWYLTEICLSFFAFMTPLLIVSIFISPKLFIT